MPRSSLLTDMLGPLDGEQIPGGCDRCDAYQTVQPLVAGIWVLHVFHDDWCPLIDAEIIQLGRTGS